MFFYENTKTENIEYANSMYPDRWLIMSWIYTVWFLNMIYFARNMFCNSADISFVVSYFGVLMLNP